MTYDVNSTKWQQFTNMPTYIAYVKRQPKQVSLQARVDRRWAGFHPKSFTGIKTLLNPWLQPLQVTSPGPQKEGHCKVHMVNVEPQ